MRKLVFIGFTLTFALANFNVLSQNSYDNYTKTLEVRGDYVSLSSTIACDGSIDVFVSNGKAPYLYSIDGGKTFSNENKFIGLCGGNYFIHVRDANNELGLTLVKMEETIPVIPVVIDTAAMISKFNNAESLLEKKKAQFELAAIGIKYPAIIKKIENNLYSVSLLNFPKDIEKFESRIIVDIPVLKRSFIEGDSLFFELKEESEQNFNQVIEKLGYQSYTIENN